MMMSPSGSCSPDGTTNYGKMWTNGVNPKLSVESIEGKVSSCGDYINMSPASCSTTSTPPDCFFQPCRRSSQANVCLLLFAPLLQTRQKEAGPEPSSDITGLESIGIHRRLLLFSEQRQLRWSRQLTAVCCQTQRSEGNGRLTRPTRLSLDASKASTLPRTRESPFPTDPKSPGEYVNIEFNDKAISTSLASLFPTVFFRK